MERPKRVSRIPTPRLPFHRQPANTLGSSRPVQGSASSSSIPVLKRPGPPSQSSFDSAKVFSTSAKATATVSLPANPTISSSHSDNLSLRLSPRVERALASDGKQALTSVPHRPLPKQRSLNILSGLSHSFSRSNLMTDRQVHHSFTISTSTPAISGTMAGRTREVSDPLPRISKSTGSLHSAGSQKTEQHPALDPCLVYDAQPSAYWSGRFVALRDRFRSENLMSENMESLMEAHSKWVHNANKHTQLADARKTRHGRSTIHLPPSATTTTVLKQSGRRVTDNFTLPDASQLLDEEDRCKRVFKHLETLCATEEARQSLLAWQQEYARKTGQKKLMPKGSNLEHQTRMSYLARILAYRKASRKSVAWLG